MRAITIVTFAFVVAACGAPAATPPASASSVATTTPPPIAATASTVTTARAYTLEDLAVLDKQHAWQQMLDHLEDIAPAARAGSVWNDLAIDAVSGFIDAERATTHDKVGLAALAEDFVGRYPTIATSPKFRAVRLAAAGDALRECGKLHTSFERCKVVPRAYEGDPKSALTAANEAAGFADRWLAMALFRDVAKTDASVCKNDKAVATMVEGLEAPEGSRFFTDARAMQDACRAQKNK